MDDVPAGPASPGPRRPSLSVVVPVRNGGRDFERCLRRLRDSHLADFELIVVDDGSTDDSAAVAASSVARQSANGNYCLYLLSTTTSSKSVQVESRSRRRQRSKSGPPLCTGITTESGGLRGPGLAGPAGTSSMIHPRPSERGTCRNASPSLGSPELAQGSPTIGAEKALWDPGCGP